MKSRGSTGATVLMIVAATVLLSACGAQPPRAASHPRTASPHPSSTAVAPTLPTVRVPIECANLFSAPTVSGLVDTTVALRQDETSVVTSLDDIAARQLGTLACVWGGSGETDGGYDQGLEVYIAPDSAAAFAENLPKIEASPPPTAENTAGDASEYRCFVFATTDDQFQCVANMLVDSYWVTVELQGDGPQITQSGANSRIQQVMDTASESIGSSARTRPVWRPPASVKPEFCSAQNSTAAIRTAFSSPGLMAKDNLSGMVYDADTVAQSSPSYAECAWQQQSFADPPAGQYSDVEVEMVRAASWAFPTLLATPPTDWYVGAYKPVTIPGAAAALLACNNADCAAIIQVDTTGVQVYFPNLGESRTTASLTGLVSAILSA